MTTATVVETLETVTKAAIPRQAKRVIKTIKPGQMIRQGDIYLINITGQKGIKVFGTTEVKTENFTSEVKSNKAYHQLVPGSTMGSRHQIKSDEISLFVNPTNESSLVGPMIRAKGDFDLVHPEHAHFTLPAGDYLVCYQLNDKTKQRVKD
jgi:hypothetical protein